MTCNRIGAAARPGSGAPDRLRPGQHNGAPGPTWQAWAMITAESGVQCVAPSPPVRPRRPIRQPLATGAARRTASAAAHTIPPGGRAFTQPGLSAQLGSIPESWKPYLYDVALEMAGFSPAQPDYAHRLWHGRALGRRARTTRVAALIIGKGGQASRQGDGHPSPRKWNGHCSTPSSRVCSSCWPPSRGVEGISRTNSSPPKRAIKSVYARALG